MSAAIDTLFAQGVEVIQASGHRREFRVLNGAFSGQVVVGTLVVAQILDPEAPLGKDVREQVTLHVLAPCPLFEYGDRLQEGSVFWEVLGRENNPADVEVTFPLRVVLPKDMA